METVEIKKGIQVGFDDLAYGLSKLSDNDLTSFFKKLNLFLGNPTNHVMEEESLLLARMKNLVPHSLIQQLKTLQVKQQQNTITDKEHEEMLMITDFIESKSIEKVEILASLSKIKQMPISDLAKQFRTRLYE
jgi:hypothetical protein